MIVLFLFSSFNQQPNNVINVLSGHLASRLPQSPFAFDKMILYSGTMTILLPPAPIVINILSVPSGQVFEFGCNLPLPLNYQLNP